MNHIDFKSYWSNKQSSMNRSSSEIYYQIKAKEHSLLLENANIRKGIIDFGCGAGELLDKLYPYFKIYNCKYNKIIFS